MLQQGYIIARQIACSMQDYTLEQQARCFVPSGQGAVHRSPAWDDVRLLLTMDDMYFAMQHVY